MGTVSLLSRFLISERNQCKDLMGTVSLLSLFSWPAIMAAG
jgi:hypothetical protein